MNREQITSNNIERALNNISIHTNYTLQEKGKGTFSSIHEILGVLEEEYSEIKEAVHKNNYKAIELELLDLATTCQFAIACINSGTLDW